jgi:hypothetical protein
MPLGTLLPCWPHNNNNNFDERLFSGHVLLMLWLTELRVGGGSLSASSRPSNCWRLLLLLLSCCRTIDRTNNTNHDTVCRLPPHPPSLKIKICTPDSRNGSVRNVQPSSNPVRESSQESKHAICSQVQKGSRCPQAFQGTHEKKRTTVAISMSPLTTHNSYLEPTPLTFFTGPVGLHHLLC